MDKNILKSNFPIQIDSKGRAEMRKKEVDFSSSEMNEREKPVKEAKK